MDSNDKAYGILGYIGFLFIIPLVAGKTEFTRFHANQGLVLFITDIVLSIAIGIINAVLGLIPIIGAILGGVLSGVLGLAILALMIVGIVHAAQGEMKPLPVIGGIQIIK
ncbi:MAG: hypothetical protein ACI4WS_06990 [Oscillospiraceae bacterium]